MTKFCEVSRLPVESGKPRAVVVANVELHGTRLQVGRAVIVDDRIDEITTAIPSSGLASDLPVLLAALHELESVAKATALEQLDKRAAYEYLDVMGALKDALRPHVKQGEMLIWREAFRWKNDAGVLANHYECMSLQDLCESFKYEVVHDFNHVAVVRRQQLPA